MTRRRARAPSWGLALLVSAGAGVGACRAESRPDAHRAVTPPVESPNAIPAGPVSGTVRGASFTVRDARFVIDRRIGYAHTDIKLSGGKAETPCGPIEPANAPSVWLRLKGPDRIEARDFRIGEDSSGEAGAEKWSVHYQTFDGTRWIGVSDASALVSLHPTPEGTLQGGLAVCFSDDAKSCVSGSFTAQNCPSSLDQPVRGAQPNEAVPEKYKLLVTDAGTAADR